METKTSNSSYEAKTFLRAVISTFITLILLIELKKPIADLLIKLIEATTEILSFFWILIPIFLLTITLSRETLHWIQDQFPLQRSKTSDRVIGILLLASAFPTVSFSPSPNETSIHFLSSYLLFFGYILCLSASPSHNGSLESSELGPILYPSEDRLGFTSHTTKLSEILSLSRPHAFGLCGPWGSGKTSFVNLVIYDLKRKGHKVAYFNPWKLESRNEAWNHFSDAVEASLERPHNSLKTLKGFVLKILQKLRLIPEPISDLLYDFLENSSRYNSKYAKRIDAKIRSRTKGRQLFIIIDDAERAEARIARGVLSMVEELDALSSCSFIFAIDRKQLSAAFEGKSQEAEGFFLKVVKQHFWVPEPSQIQLLGWRTDICSNSPRLRSCIQNLGRHFEGFQLREQKAFLKHAIACEELYLKDKAVAKLDWTPMFLFLLLDYYLDGFASSCRRSGLAKMVEDFQSAHIIAKEGEPVTIPGYISTFIKNLANNNYTEDWVRARVTGLLDSFGWISSISPSEVEKCGFSWPALTESKLAEILNQWVSRPETDLLHLIETHKNSNTTTQDAVNFFLNTALERYNLESGQADSSPIASETGGRAQWATLIFLSFSQLPESKSFARLCDFLFTDFYVALIISFRKDTSHSVCTLCPDAPTRQAETLLKFINQIPPRNAFRLLTRKHEFLGEFNIRPPRCPQLLKAVNDIEPTLWKRIGIHLLNCFTKKEDFDSLELEMKTQFEWLMWTPKLWIEQDSRERARFLSLVEEAPNNAQIQNVFIEIFRTLVPGDLSKLAQLRQLCREDPEYLSSIWMATHSTPLNPLWANALKARRDAIIQTGLNELKAIFPDHP